MPTQEQVLAAVDALGCGVSPSPALMKRLGFANRKKAVP